MKIIMKPNNEEYHANELRLADLIPNDGLLLEHLATNLEITKKFILSVAEDKLLYRYAEGKWSIKEVIIHLIDMERIYTYRALRFARNDKTILPGFDDNEYVKHSGANNRDIFDLFKELKAVRGSTIAMIEGLEKEAFIRSGIINGKSVSARALLYHIAGHELHHLKIIREKYLA
jgi:uncharacterized damage-inducible protein DinB